MTTPSPPNKLIVHFPREYIHALRKARGHRRWLGLLFLALVGFNLFDILSAQPADAELLTDLTLAGRTAGDAIMQFSFTMMQDLYGGKYGVLAYISKSCLWLATPLVAVGVIQYMSEDLKGSPVSRPVILGRVFYFILLSGGGTLFGHAYIELMHGLEGIILKMDGFLKLYDRIAEGKAYLSTSSIISASVAECQKFVGQEQQRCIAQATNSALQHLGDFKEQFPLSKWLSDDIDQLKQIAGNILSPDKNIVEKAMNIWYAWNAPMMEIEMAAKMTAAIASYTAIYATVILFIGLGGPIAGLSSMLVPALQNGWVAWLVGILGIWYWRFSYLIMCWILSEMLTKAPSASTIGTGWFSNAIGNLAPILSGAIAFAGAGGTWMGITSAIGAGHLGEDAQKMGQDAGMQNSSPGSPSSPAPAASASAPQVRTDY
jgi:hypothetical protein